MLRKLQRALCRRAKAATECPAAKRLGKPDTGNPSVRFDEGSESDGHWRKPFTPSAPAYSTAGVWKPRAKRHRAIVEQQYSEGPSIALSEAEQFFNFLARSSSLEPGRPLFFSCLNYW